MTVVLHAKHCDSGCGRISSFAKDITPFSICLSAALNFPPDFVRAAHCFLLISVSANLLKSWNFNVDEYPVGFSKSSISEDS